MKHQAYQKQSKPTRRPDQAKEGTRTTERPNHPKSTTKRRTKKPTRRAHPKTPKTARTALKTSLTTSITLISLLSPSKPTTQMYDYLGRLFDNTVICTEPSREHYYPAFIKKGEKVSFHIDLADPNNREFVDDGAGNNRFLLVSRGSTCRTLDTSTRSQFMALYISTHPDASPPDPAHPFHCKVSRYILSNDLIPCSNSETYKNIETVYTFISPSVASTWDKIIPNSKISIIYIGIIPMVDMNKNFFSIENLDQNFLELLVLKPQRPETTYTMNQYETKVFQNQRNLLQKEGVVFTTKMFLESIVYDKLPGFHPFPDPAKGDGRIGFIWSQARYVHQRGIQLHFYISKPTAFDDTNEALIQYQPVSNQAAPKLKPPFMYNIWIRKVGPGKIRFLLTRLNTDTLSAISHRHFLLDLTKNDEFIHFGVQLSEGLFYYKSDSEAVIMVYETIWAWHDGTRYQKFEKVTKTVNPQEFTVAPGNEYYLIYMKYFNYNDWTDKPNTESTTNIFGIRFFHSNWQPSAYPLQATSITTPANLDHENRCGLFMFGSTRCAGYATLKKRDDSAFYYFTNTYTSRTDSCPRSDCIVCLWKNNCLFPKDGYNREFVSAGHEGVVYGREMMAEFEGSGAEAVAKRAGRVLFTSVQGDKYWMRCPVDCSKTCDENLDCLDCPDSGQTPQLRAGRKQCGCNNNLCAKCESDTKCLLCASPRKTIINPADPLNVPCLPACPQRYGLVDSTETSCKPCPQLCGSCDFRNQNTHCKGCFQPNFNKRMDYAKSPYIQPTDPNFGKIHCEVKQAQIDGFYAAETDLDFQPCLQNCKKCSDGQTCEICQTPSGTPIVYPYQASTPHLCTECKEDHRYVDQNNLCVDCPAECTKCSSATNCTECRQNYFLMNLQEGPCVPCPSSGYKISQNQCIKGCGPSEYADSKNECEPCPLHCSTCSDLTGACSACEAGHSFKTGSKDCWKSCPEKHYRKEIYTCSACSKHCLECLDVTGECKTCQNNFEISPVNNKECFRLCPEFQYETESKDCRPCPANCKECQRLSGLCSDCGENYEYDVVGNNCLLVSLPARVLRSTFNNRNQEVYFVFNQRVEINNIEGLKFRLVNPEAPEEASVDLKGLQTDLELVDDGERISAKFDFKRLERSFEGHQVLIDEGIPDNIRARANSSVVYKEYPIAIKGVSYYQSVITDTAVTLAGVSGSSLTVISVVMLFFSLSFAVAMIKLYQLIFFLMFINVEMPSNAGRMIETFRMTPLDYTPDIRELFGRGEGAKVKFWRRVLAGGGSGSGSFGASGMEEGDSWICLTHRKFDENGLGCGALDNTGKFFTQIAVFLGIKIVVFLLLRLTIYLKNRKNRKFEKSENDKNHPKSKNSNNKNHQNKPSEDQNQASKVDKTTKISKNKQGFVLKNLTKIDNSFTSSSLLNLLKAIQLKAILGVMVSLHSQDYRTQKIGSRENLAISTLTMILYMALILFLGLVVSQRWQARKTNDLDSLDLHNTIITSLKLEKEFKVKDHPKEGIEEVFLVFTLSADFLIPIVLVLFIEAPTAQITLILIIKAIWLAMTVKYRSFRLRVRNLLEICNNSFYILILLTNLAMHCLRGRMGETARFDSFGFLVVVLISLMMILNFFCAVFQFFGNFCCKRNGNDGKVVGENGPAGVGEEPKLNLNRAREDDFGLESKNKKNSKFDKNVNNLKNKRKMNRFRGAFERGGSKIREDSPLSSISITQKIETGAGPKNPNMKRIRSVQEDSSLLALKSDQNGVEYDDND